MLKYQLTLTQQRKEFIFNTLHSLSPKFGLAQVKLLKRYFFKKIRRPILGIGVLREKFANHCIASINNSL